MSEDSTGEDEHEHEHEHEHGHHLDGDHHDGHLKIDVTVRTPAGISRDFDVWQNELDADVITTSVRYFSRRGELEAADYGLALVRGGQATVMTDSGRLSDYGVVDGDTLSLIAKAPEVDGACCSRPS